MKRIIIVLMLMLPIVMFAASSQDFSDQFDTGETYTCTYTADYEGIANFHESDWLMYESQSGPGNWFQVYYDDSSVTPAIYVYLFSCNLSYKRYTLASNLMFTVMDNLIQSEPWLKKPNSYTVLPSMATMDTWIFLPVLNGKLLM